MAETWGRKLSRKLGEETRWVALARWTERVWRRRRTDDRQMRECLSKDSVALSVHFNIGCIVHES